MAVPEHPARPAVRRLRTLKLRAALLPLVLLAACATQGPGTITSTPDRTPTAAAMPPVAPAEQAALRNMRAMQDRLFKVTAPLLTANAPLCKGNARYLLGFTAKNKYSFSLSMANAAQSVGFDDRLQVTDVLPGSGAAHNDVQRGDFLISAGDKPIPQGQNAERLTAGILQPLIAGHAPIKLGLQRGTAQMTVNVPLTLACSFSVELGNADIVNAYADGQRVLVTRGMMNFVRTDEELAYLIAKELAHNALSQPGRQKIFCRMDRIWMREPIPWPSTCWCAPVTASTMCRLSGSGWRRNIRPRCLMAIPLFIRRPRIGWR
jgi:hypothetical protein